MQSLKIARKALKDENYALFSGFIQGDVLKRRPAKKTRIEDYSEFTYLSLIQTYSLDIELTYTFKQIVENYELLSKFNIDSQAIEASILLGDYEHALGALDQLDVDFGLSLWAIDLRFAILGSNERQEELKSLFEKVRSGAGNGFLPGYAANLKAKVDYQSGRKTISDNIRSRVKRYKSERDFEDYLLYRLADDLDISDQNIANVLFNENRSSIIDVFTTARDIVRRFGATYLLGKLNSQQIALLDLDSGVNKIIQLMSDVPFGYKSTPNFERDSILRTIMDIVLSETPQSIDLDQISALSIKFARTRVGGFSRLATNVIEGLPSTLSHAAQSDNYIKWSNFDTHDGPALENALLRFAQQMLNIYNIIELPDYVARYLESEKLDKSVMYKKFKILLEIKTEKFSSLAKSMVTEHLVSGVPINRLPIRDLMIRFDAEYPVGGPGSLDSVLVSHFGYIAMLSERGQERAQEELGAFLEANNVSLPSQLDISSATVQIQNYFYHNVCSRDMLDYLYTIESEKALISERIDCLKKIDLDSYQNAGAVKAHIIELFDFLDRLDDVESLNRSKLRLDLDRITQITSEKLAHDYQKMIEIFDESEIQSKEKMLTEIIRTRRVSKDFGKVEDDNAYSLLRHIVESIRDTYLFDSSVGMSQALGTRIRHNILLEEIASPMISKEIYIKPNSSKAAKIVKTWIQITDIPESKIQRSLDEFTQDIIRIVNDFKNKYIHVRNDSHKDGVFYVEIGDQFIAAMAGMLTKDMVYADFLGKVIDSFSNQELHERIVFMRNKIDSVLAPQIHGRLNNLRRSLASKNNRLAIENTFKEISVELDSKIADIKRWFSLESSINHGKVYTLEKSITASIDNYCIDGSSFDRDRVVYRVCPATYSYALHDTLTYILMILIDNSAKYADEGQIIIDVCQINSSLEVKYKSPLTNRDKIARLQSHWADIQEAISNGTIDQMSYRDYGSGLAKIWQHLNSTNSQTYRLNIENGEAEFTLAINYQYVDDIISKLGQSS